VRKLTDAKKEEGTALNIDHRSPTLSTTAEAKEAAKAE
jgi:hypothetical protein